MRRTISSLLLLVAGGAATAVPTRSAAAQEEDARAYCLRGRPAAECSEFLVATLNLLVGPSGDGAMPIAEWEVGWMVNREGGDAGGGSVAVGTSELGVHLAAKARYRRWLGRAAALDVGAGVMVAEHAADGDPHRPTIGLAGDASFGNTDIVAVTVRGHLLDSGISGAVGVRFGTVPGVVVTVVGGALLLGAMAGSV